jgi:plasmid stability protein
MDAAGAVLKTVRLELPENVHYTLRVAAAKHEMSMASFARKLVEEGLRRKEKASEAGL